MLQTYTDDQIKTLMSSEQGADLVRTKLKGECSKYSTQANLSVDINRKRGRKKNRKRKRKKNKKLKKRDTGTSLKKLVTKARVDQHLLAVKTPFVGIYITFGENMAKFFNLKKDQIILVGVYGVPPDELDTDFYLKLTPDLKKRKIEKFCVYSDIVNPEIRFGDQITNLLDLISVDTGNNIYRQMVPTQYKPLKHPFITSVSISVTDIDGFPIIFEDEAVTTFELQIRPKENYI